MIGIDWATTSFRAFRMVPDGAIRDRKASGGTLSVQNGRFGDRLREEIGPWLAAGERHVLLCGMIGGRRGWIEAPYLSCPAGPAEIAAALIEVPFDWAQVKLLPGLTCTDAAGIPEVMRGEEAQVAGVLDRIGPAGLACIPGGQTKWARIEFGRIESFATHLTGEATAALRGHTILGRTIRDAAPDGAAFDAGLARSGQRGGLLHHVFGVRALALAGQLSDVAGASYLSGLLIGHEVRAALAEAPPATVVQLIGAPDLTAPYARAIEAVGGMAEPMNGEAVARGLALIGSHARWG